MPANERVTYRPCHLCEALCGIEIHARGDEIVGVRGDPADPFGPGHSGKDIQTIFRVE